MNRSQQRSTAAIPGGSQVHVDGEIDDPVRRRGRERRGDDATDDADAREPSERVVYVLLALRVPPGLDANAPNASKIWLSPSPSNASSSQKAPFRRSKPMQLMTVSEEGTAVHAAFYEVPIRLPVQGPDAGEHLP